MINKLEVIAKRFAEISEEIKTLKSRREENLGHCHKSEDEDFESDKLAIDRSCGLELKESCLHVAYRWYKEDIEESGYSGDYANFNEVIHAHGCKNCIGAYEAKKEIGKLKQERGRLMGQVTKIGQRL
jgi:hypothetical protein